MLPHVVTATREDCVDSVTFLAFEVIATESVIVFVVTDDGFNRIAAFKEFL